MRLNYGNVQSNILDIKPCKRTEVFNFGADNLYPNLIEALIGMSVTAKNCSDNVAKAIYGKSFGEIGKVIVNSKGQSLNEVLRLSSREYSKHNNYYLQIGYNGLYEIKSIVLVPTTYVRIGKADDKGYSGKYIVYDNWDKSKRGKIMSNDFQVIDVFNPNAKVVERQAEAAGGIEKYKGQILHVKKDSSFKYSLSDLNVVLSEALLEANSQTFRSKGAEKGFLNAKVVTTQPFKDDNERKAFRRELSGFKGADNSSEILHIEASQRTDDITKQIQIDDLSGKFDDKLFQYSDSQAEKNICKAFVVPLILVNPSDNSMFGNSGELVKEAKSQLWDSREEDRDQMEEVFNKLMSKFSEPIEGLQIVSPYGEDEEEEEAEDVNAVAQANLRGSVGGVTALLAIQQSVAAGTTTLNSGVAMIENIYGFSNEIATQMLGNPEQV